MNGGGRKKKVTLCQWAHAYFIRRHELASGRELRCFDHLGEIIVLFSALEQTHYAIIACDSDSDSRMWLVWLAFLLQFKKNKKYIDRSGVLTTLFCCYVVGAEWNCYSLGAHFVYII